MSVYFAATTFCLINKCEKPIRIMRIPLILGRNSVVNLISNFT